MVPRDVECDNLQAPLQHQTIGTRFMLSLDGWIPQKQLEHGDQQVEAARRFLQIHRGSLSQESLDEADSLLNK